MKPTRPSCAKTPSALLVENEITFFITSIIGFLPPKLKYGAFGCEICTFPDPVIQIVTVDPREPADFQHGRRRGRIRTSARTRPRPKVKQATCMRLVYEKQQQFSPNFYISTICIALVITIFYNLSYVKKLPIFMKSKRSAAGHSARSPRSARGRCCSAWENGLRPALFQGVVVCLQVES